MIMGSPEKLKCSNWINPVTMSHMLSNIKPMFFVSLISFISLRKNCDSLIGISFFCTAGIPTYKTQSRYLPSRDDNTPEHASLSRTASGSFFLPDYLFPRPGKHLNPVAIL